MNKTTINWISTREMLPPIITAKKYWVIKELNNYLTFETAYFQGVKMNELGGLWSHDWVSNKNFNAVFWCEIPESILDTSYQP